MASIMTTLSKGYQPNLTIAFALAEIVSNAYDGETRGKANGEGEMTLAYNENTKKLIVANAKTVIPSSALLLGTSESRGQEDCIGTFGEGLPMALLILSRNRYAVTIHNGNEKWEPCIQRHPEFREDVLCIKTRQLPKARTDFVVEVDNIEEADWRELTKKFLKLDPSYDPNLTITANPHGGEKVLLQAQYKGMIYNKGVFVQERDKLLFGYDLNTVLNRDRTMMSEWTLQSELAGMLKGAVKKDKERFLPILERSVFSDTNSNASEVQDSYSTLQYDSEIREHFSKKFAERYGDKAIPVGTQAEVVEAERLGRRAVVCSPLLHKLVADRCDSLIGLKGAAATEVLVRHELENLTPEEQICVDELERVMFKLAPKAQRALVIVDFGSSSTMSRAFPQLNNICLPRWLLAQRPKALVQVVRELVVGKHLPDMTNDTAADVTLTLAKLYLCEGGDFADFVSKLTKGA